MALFWEGGSLWIGLTNVRSDYHAHHAIQLGLALTGTCQFRTRKDPDWVYYSGALIPPSLEHSFQAPCRQVGYPQSIRVDQGSEFISRDLDLWAYQKDVVLDFSRPGKPTDNAFIESFNGKFRAECLNAHWFLSLDDARAKMEEWRKDYNEVRPHSAIGNTATPERLPPGKSPAGWSKIGGHVNQPKDSPQNRRELGAQVT